MVYLVQLRACRDVVVHHEEVQLLVLAVLQINEISFSFSR